jgi:hypothetical protein
MVETLYEIERDWRETLGDERFTQLKQLLGEVWLTDLVQTPQS